MISMVDFRIRGDVSLISSRHAQAKKSYMVAFEACQPISYILFLDRKNLSRLAMSHSMTLGGFESMTAAEAREIDWLPKTVDQPVGYFLEPSIHYPVELNEADNDNMLAPEGLDVQGMMLRDNEVELRTH